MPDKLTDAEIVKALEWLERKTKEYCEQCDYINCEVCAICIFDKIKLALAENERLKANLNIELEEFASEYDNKIKAEAYKEFAERLKKCSFTIEYSLYDEVEVVRVYEIDDLLKELVGEDNG